MHSNADFVDSIITSKPRSVNTDAQPTPYTTGYTEMAVHAEYDNINDTMKGEQTTRKFRPDGRKDHVGAKQTRSVKQNIENDDNKEQSHHSCTEIRDAENHGIKFWKKRDHQGTDSQFADKLTLRIQRWVFGRNYRCARFWIHNRTWTR